MEFNESPLFLVLDPTPPPAQRDSTKNANLKLKLPLSLYESELHMLNGAPTMLFVKAPFKVHTTECEGIALDHISKVAPSGTSNQSSCMDIYIYISYTFSKPVMLGDVTLPRAYGTLPGHEMNPVDWL